DGMLKGPNVEATQAINDAVGVNVIASGGITSLADIEVLKSINVSGAIIGRALYTNALSLKDAIAMAHED
ncbi:1-(5-phosphoribosyl)-5-((5-phosphoribosylamino)methylideneamino)imidazole-4-carboxamide isomerase, partial [Candidatus Poribacteria bacterium]|nr:1-(5-phosphoribosyl)-5-((5-phosphoribosylamino)methylideneamino)imidazole-4-carboxamide isomerase [Candidatus Poribacteria bacterium]